MSVYYLGTLVGCMLGGWIGDKIGRIKTIGVSSAWAIFGACLQCSAQNVNWMICARLLNGIGTGGLNAIVPVWSTETAPHSSRGTFIAVEFFLNIFGVVVAYWLGFGASFINNGESEACWRVPIAFQILPLLGLFAGCWFFPESPRYLIKIGRVEEGWFILKRLRGDSGPQLAAAELELQDIKNIVALEKKSAKRTSYVSMFLGRGSGELHTARRGKRRRRGTSSIVLLTKFQVQLVIWLQIVQEWVGIAGVTVCRSLGCQTFLDS